MPMVVPSSGTLTGEGGPGWHPAVHALHWSSIGQPTIGSHAAQLGHSCSARGDKATCLPKRPAHARWLGERGPGPEG